MILRHSLLRHSVRSSRIFAQIYLRHRHFSIRAGAAAALHQSSVNELDSVDSSTNDATTEAFEGPGPAKNETLIPRSTTVENYFIQKRQNKAFRNLGSVREPFYKPNALVTNPFSVQDVTLELLLASEAHQGHKTSLWNPSNARYIMGIRQGVHIISLEVTAAHLRRAAKIVSEVSRRAGIILFVGTRKGQERCVVKAAELSGGYHIFDRWTPGSITNGEQILGQCKLKVIDELDNEIPGLDEQLQEHTIIKPDLVVCLNPLENSVLLSECGQNNIPSIGIIDTDVDPSSVTYPIPANDDSLRCVQVIAGVLGRAGEDGRRLRLQAASQGNITYTPAQGLKLPGNDWSA